MRGGMKKVNKNIFSFVDPVARVLPMEYCQWKQNNRNDYEMISQPKITHLKVPV